MTATVAPSGRWCAAASKAFTPMERQVLGQIHRLVYQEDGSFYRKWMHDPRHALGAMCSGGTVANLTALWVARNRAFPAEGSFRGLHEEGLFRALKYYGHEGAAIVVSKRGHYSLRKAADVLGLGRDALVPVETDEFNRIQPGVMAFVADIVANVCLAMRAQADELGAQIAANALANAAYTYQSFSDDDLLAYAEALEHPEMQQVYTLMNAVQYEIMANRFEAVATRLAAMQPSQDL